MSKRLHEPKTISLDAGKKPLAPHAEQTTGGESPDASLDLRMPEGRTPLANAARFVNLHGHNLHWCEALHGWLTWNGRRWVLDRQHQAMMMAKDVVRKIWSDVNRLRPDIPPRLAAELTAFAKKTASASGLREMLALTKSEPGIAVSPAAMDAHPWLLNVDNGTIDLRSGTLREHRREDYLTKLAPFDFVMGAEAACPLFDKFLVRIFDGNTAVIDYLQRLIGSALAGQVFDHALPIFWGRRGANGKSVLIETILHVLGDYSATAPPGLLLTNKGYERHPTELADLAGRRCVFCVETDQDRKLAEGRVKQLTGGDRVKGRFMGKDFFEFSASFTIFLVTNHLPVIRGVDEAIWRRPRVVPFNVSIPTAEQDDRLTDKLKAEAAGILRWCLNGCLAWQRDGLSEPAEVLEATAAYRHDMDVLAEFISESCLVGPGHRIRAGELYSEYDRWCRENGEQKLSGRAFGLAMTGKEFTRFKSSGWWYSGIQLKS